MVGVLLITHGNIGTALLEGAAHVLGAKPANTRAIAVAATDDPQQVLERARDEANAIDDGAGVLVMSDIFGATPSNVGTRLLERGRVEGVAGVSLPMLVRALAYRHLPLQQVVVSVMEAGTRGQVNMREDA